MPAGSLKLKKWRKRWEDMDFGGSRKTVIAAVLVAAGCLALIGCTAARKGQCGTRQRPNITVYMKDEE